MAKIVFHAFMKSNDQEVRFAAGEYRDKMYLDIRIYFKNEETEEWHPTKKGITLPIEMLPDFRKGLDLLYESIHKSPCSD